MEINMKEKDLVEITAHFELGQNIVNKEGATRGLIETIIKAYQDNYEDPGRIKLLFVTPKHGKYYR